MRDAAADPVPPEARRHWMAVLARASTAELEAALSACGAVPAHSRVRGPEAGLVMVRGRIGGGGGAFNLGEMTVTRCTVRTAGGMIGHAYVTGRDERKAELAALCDALLQDGRCSGALREAVRWLHDEQQQKRETLAAKAAATRVQFFAMETWRGGVGA